MHVEMRNINDIKPYPHNPRHNDHAIDAVAASIQAFGFRQPLVVDEGSMIVVGDTRLKAAKKLGLTVVPVHVAVGLTAAQCKAYRLADNKSAELANWNDDLLVQELADLQKMDIDLDLLGFFAEELNRLIDTASNPGLTDPDDVPQPPDEPTTQSGDLWVLGHHHLLCGHQATFSPRALFTAINRQGVLFLWPIRLPGADSRVDEWSRTALEAAGMAARGWVRVAANLSLGAYEVIQAAGQLGEPEWPSTPFQELLRVAFKDRYIGSLDHPVLRRLRGEA